MSSSARTRFLATYYPCQAWSLPSSVIFYIAKNPSSINIYQKMTKLCKYFFLKNPILISNGLYYSNYGDVGWKHDSDLTRKKINMETSCKLWIANILNVYSKDDMNLAASIIPKIYKCNLKYLYIHFQVISYKDFMVFVSTVESVTLDHVTVIDDEGTKIELGKIGGIFPRLKYFTYSDNLKAPNINAKTFKEFLKLPRFHELNYFILFNVPENFDIETFYTYMKKNKHTKFSLHYCFDTIISEVLKARLDSIIDEIIDSEEHDYMTPYITYSRMDFLKREKMFELYSKHL